MAAVNSIARRRRLIDVMCQVRRHLELPGGVPRAVAVLLAIAVVLSAGARTAADPAAETRTKPSPRFALACTERVQSRLFFGLRGPAGPVSDVAWETFLADVVTPRFPDGLTVFQASGQWRGASERLEREPSRVVEIVHDESPDAGHRIGEIVTIYKTRHQQESVMVSRAQINVCF